MPLLKSDKLLIKLQMAVKSTMGRDHIVSATNKLPTTRTRFVNSDQTAVVVSKHYEQCGIPPEFESQQAWAMSVISRPCLKCYNPRPTELSPKQ